MIKGLFFDGIYVHGRGKAVIESIKRAGYIAARAAEPCFAGRDHAFMGTQKAAQIL